MSDPKFYYTNKIGDLITPMSVNQVHTLMLCAEIIKDIPLEKFDGKVPTPIITLVKEDNKSDESSPQESD